MSLKNMTSLLYKVAFRGRLLVTAVTLLFIMYGIIYLWFYVPYGGPGFLWRPDSQLIIQTPQPGSELLPGDVVLAIGDTTPQRMRPIYPLPLQAEYAFTVQRGGETLTHLIVVDALLNSTIISFYLPATLLSLAGWLVGAIILLLARFDNRQAITTGLIFLLGAAVLIAIQASLEGAPGAWLVGHVLIFIQAVSWVYLGTIPRSGPLPARIRKLFAGLYGVAAVLGLTAVYEVLYLFPQGTSYQEIVGISLYSLGFILSALGLITCIILLTVRLLRLPRSAYLRQQLAILLIFIAIGTLPAMFLTILPHAIWDVALLPFPAAITLMLFIPAGYLFVIYRKGFLGLDLFFSRVIHLVLLSLLVFAFYTGGLFLVQRWLQLPGSEVLAPATVIFFPTLLLTLYASEPVSRFVQQAIYGNIVLSQDALAELALTLSARPEITTLENMVTAVARILDISQASLALKDDSGKLIPVGNADCWPTAVPQSVTELENPLLRSRSEDKEQVGTLLSAFDWAELLIPVRIRHESIGVLALSRPGADGFFNARQLNFLTQAAGVIAVGSENITLFESTRKLSRQLLAVQEQERKKLSRQIHDDPLQEITYATSVIDQIVAEASQKGGLTAVLQKAASHLRTAASTLREICVGLYPPFREQGIELAVREIVHHFQTTYGLDTAVAIHNDSPANTVDHQLATAVCHILTEALHNIVKHASEGQAEVSLSLSSTELNLTIADSGPGTHLTQRSVSELIRLQHLGIVGMHEWARLVGGELQIKARNPTGTVVELNVPSQIKNLRHLRSSASYKNYDNTYR